MFVQRVSLNFSSIFPLRVASYLQHRNSYLPSSRYSIMSEPRTFIINLMGDVMLGRLIEQMFPIHVECPEEADIISTFRNKHAHLKNYGPESPWGNALPLIKSGDLNIVNLETSVTTHSKKWPNKVFNYRMHPKNIEALKVAQIDYVSLANNHTLDFSKEGLLETVQTLANANIAFAGAGLTADLASKPAQLRLPRRHRTSLDLETSSKNHLIHAYSYSDHPQDWASVPEFNLLDYAKATRDQLKLKLSQPDVPTLKILSIHWGPNYRRAPATDIKSLARFFIDECGVDLIHGHSSHHVQGVELYKGKLIIYGCGDFVDDYAVDPQWRNDLSALWRVGVEEEGDGLKLKSLEIFPNRIKTFQAGLLDQDDDDHRWLTARFRELCAEMETNVEDDLGSDGQIIIKVS